MDLQKSMLLPVLGMFTLAIFTWLAYMRNSAFIDELLICGFVFSAIFIMKIRTNT